jgi:hypothetical protein
MNMRRGLGDLYSDLSDDGLDPIVPEDMGSGSGAGMLTLNTDPGVNPAYFDGTAPSSDGSSVNWGSLIDSIGKNAVNVINASNHAPISTSYAATQGQAETTAPAAGAADYQSTQAAGSGSGSGTGIMGWMENPKNMPLIIGGFAGVALLLAVSSGGGGRR